MFRKLVYCAPLLLMTGAVLADDAPVEEEKVSAGMSIVGNHEAPKSLVIVPWKSSEFGNVLNLSRILDDGRQPVDKEVFMRELDYYRIRAESSGAAPQPTSSVGTR